LRDLALQALQLLRDARERLALAVGIGVCCACRKGHTRYKAMTLEPGEFMRRFLLHVLPGGFHRIRHYGLLANGSRTANLAVACQLLCEPTPARHDNEEAVIKPPTFVCMHCGRAMVILQIFTRGQAIRAPPDQSAR
jgi:hypothetical protein